MAMNLAQELTEARQAATTLSDLQSRADRLPALEKQAAREQRIESATARLSQAVVTHTAAVAEARPRMADYHERLVPIIEELDKLAEVLAYVGAEMRDATLRVNSACYALSQAREPAAEDYYQASVSARTAETIVDDLSLANTQDLGPWTGNAVTNLLIKLIVDRTVAQGGVIFDPAWPMR